MEDYLKEEVENREAELQEQLGRAEKIRELVNTLGWKIFEEEMMFRVQAAGSELKKASDMRMIGFYQGTLRVLDGLLRFPKTEIQAGKDANLELEGRNE